MACTAWPFQPAVEEQFVQMFNQYVDRVEDQKTLGGQSSRLNKGKTRPLIFFQTMKNLDNLPGSAWRRPDIVRSSGSSNASIGV